MKPQDLINLAKGAELIQDLKTKDEVLQVVHRYKSGIPFSQRLNDWINYWFEQHKEIFVFTDVNDFDSNDLEGTLSKHINRFKETGKIHIWTGASDNTIFWDATINHKFRAWHDYIHVTEGYGFDFVGESIVSDIQKSMLPPTWFFEKELIHSEVTGQAQYNSIHGDFVPNQRVFTVKYILNPLEALRVR